MNSKSFLLVIIAALSTSCASGPTDTPAESVRDTASSKDKMTSVKLRPTAGNQLRMALKVSVDGVDRKASEAVFLAFNDQIKIFNECQHVSKLDTFLIEATWASNKAGAITKAKIKRAKPNDPAITGCFMKQIRGLDLGPQAAAYTGGITLTSYRGELAPFDPKGHRHFEK